MTREENRILKEEWQDFVYRANRPEGDFDKSGFKVPYIDGINWAYRRMELLEKVAGAAKRTVLIHNHASVFCTTCGIDQYGVKELREALRALEGADDDKPKDPVS